VVKDLREILALKDGYVLRRARIRSFACDYAATGSAVRSASRIDPMAGSGATGAAGGTGPTGPTTTTRVSDSATSAASPNAGTLVSKTVVCPGATVLVGGGAHFTTTGSNDAKLALKVSFPSAAGVDGIWTASAVVSSNIIGGYTVTLIVYAVCA
jgi:hypothetical protein